MGRISHVSWGFHMKLKGFDISDFCSDSILVWLGWPSILDPPQKTLFPNFFFLEKPAPNFHPKMFPNILMVIQHGRKWRIPQTQGKCPPFTHKIFPNIFSSQHFSKTKFRLAWLPDLHCLGSHTGAIHRHLMSRRINERFPTQLPKTGPVTKNETYPKQPKISFFLTWRRCFSRTTSTRSLACEQRLFLSFLVGVLILNIYSVICILDMYIFLWSLCLQNQYIYILLYIIVCHVVGVIVNMILHQRGISSMKFPNIPKSFSNIAWKKSVGWNYGAGFSVFSLFFFLLMFSSSSSSSCCCCCFFLGATPGWEKLIHPIQNANLQGLRLPMAEMPFQSAAIPGGTIEAQQIGGIHLKHQTCLRLGLMGT